MPGFTFPAVGPLDIGSPPYRPVTTLLHSDHRYYDPLRLPTALLGFLRSSLSSPNTLLASHVLCLPQLSRNRCWSEANQKRQGSWSPGTPSLPGFPTRKQLDLPSSRATPVDTCPALRPRWCPEYSPYRTQDCCLPTRCKASTFTPRLPGKLIPITTTIHISGLIDAACILDPSGFGLPLQGLPSDFTTDLLAKL